MDTSKTNRPTIILITGYRQMGKDYISHHGLDGYEILVNPKVSDDKINCLMDNLGKSPIVKFAQPLRELLRPFMGLSNDIINRYDEIKDVNGVIPYEGCIRDYFIGIGKSVREVDPDFFVKRTILDIQVLGNKVIIISDWRYPNELDVLKEKFDVITLRVHRLSDVNGKEIPIPSEEITSEHSLDHVYTDFLVYPKYHESTIILDILSQYKNYEVLAFKKLK